MFNYSGEVQDKKKKNFIDLVKVPGMIIMILICTMGRYTINGMAAMIGDWISVTVSYLADSEK